MKVWVTGVSSCIGAGIVTRFLESGHEVWGSSRGPLPYGVPGRFTHIREAFQDLRSLPPIDLLVHAAAAVPSTVVDPETYSKVNCQGTEQLLRLASEAGCPSYVFLSTMSVYGQVDVPIVYEDLEARNVDAYGLSKIKGEALFECLREAGHRTLIIRLPGVIGRGSKNNFLSRTLEKLRENELISAFNPDAPFNNAALDVDVARLVEAWQFGGWPACTVNFGASGALPIREVIEILRAEVGSSSLIEFEESKQRPFTISTERLRALGFDPQPVRECLRTWTRSLRH